MVHRQDQQGLVDRQGQPHQVTITAEAKREKKRDEQIRRTAKSELRHELEDRYRAKLRHFAQARDRDDADLQVGGDGLFVELVGLARQFDLAVQRLVRDA